MAKIYLSCHRPDLANEIASELIVAGHQVVSHWHIGDRPRPAADDHAAWIERANENAPRILDADVLVLIAGPERYPGGKFCEFTYAGCHGKRLFVLGRVENGMLHLTPFEHVGDVKGLAAALAG